MTFIMQICVKLSESTVKHL